MTTRLEQIREHSRYIAVTGFADTSAIATLQNDLAALLAVASAVEAQTKGVGDCPLCGCMWYHADTCPMTPLLEAAP